MIAAQILAGGPAMCSQPHLHSMRECVRVGGLGKIRVRKGRSVRGALVTLLHDLESNETALGAACGAPPTRAGPTTVGARELADPFQLSSLSLC